MTIDISRFGMNVASNEELKAILKVLKENTSLHESVRLVRSDELTSEEVAKLNRIVVENSFSCYVKATIDNLETLLGAKVCGEGDNPTVTIQGKGYIFENNKYNRPVSMSRIVPMTKLGTYSNLASRGLWATSAGILVYDWTAQTVSAQHTKIALLYVAHTCPEVLESLWLHCFFGLPPQYKDWTDKGRARNKIQDTYSDESVFPESVFEEIQLERTPEGSDRIKERTGLIKLRSKIASSVLNRFAGKDIAKTGDKLSWSEERAFADRLVDPLDLDRLCLKVWEAAKSPSGKQDRAFTQLFELSVIGTGLILASNRREVLESEIAENVIRLASESPEEYTDRKNAYRAQMLADDSLVRIDWELVDRILAGLAESSDNSGPYEKVFKDLFDRKAKDKRTDKFSKLLYSKLSISAMSAFVQLVKNVEQWEANPIDSSVWTSYRIVDNKAPTAYRCFGGMDLGFVNSRKGKDSDE